MLSRSPLPSRHLSPTLGLLLAGALVLAALPACSDSGTPTPDGSTTADLQADSPTPSPDLEPTPDAMTADSGPGPMPDVVVQGDVPQTCFASPDDACGSCSAKNCCPESTACANDRECQQAAVCLGLQCQDDFETCVDQCNSSGNATFTTYAACLADQGCDTACGR